MPKDYPVELLTLGQLCLLLHRKPATVYADIAGKRFDRLPPIVRLPGQRKLFWRKQDVFDWIDRHVQPAVAATVVKLRSRKAVQKAEGVAESRQSRRSGRPTKREQLERLAAMREGR
ncbi:DNA-binding protein [Burkholderia pyrrocinia]|uniref:DNA-binding protein n=1 Tax=Burkholderia pyrrocinia TaxID=60550 RepID=UPI001BCE9F17|nr:DNA-binding protein [Burkholderia pyrrocinia]QVN17282.1 DNA-binding protein [Burkholderia pyrrocinia]